MKNLRRFLIAALAAATVTIGSLATAPTAFAMEMTFKQRETIATGYWGTGMAFYLNG